MSGEAQGIAENAEPSLKHAADASCAGKTKFLNWDLANKMAKKATKKSRTRVSVYRCDICRSWHIGGRHS